MKRNGGFLESIVWHFYERSHWKWRRKLPALPARLLSAANIFSKKLYRNQYYVNLPSYDGSRQLTHPDVVSYRGEIWLTATPYPYSHEAYEDPCVYRSKDGCCWQPCKGVYPLVRLKTSEIGRLHYSDPVLLPSEHGLLMYYRRRVREPQAVTDSLHVSCCRDGVHWSVPQLICESERNNYISPAVLTCNDGFMMFHIDLFSHQQTGALILRSSIDGIDWGNESECRVLGLKPDTGLWHIAVYGSDGSKTAGSGGLMGLFVIKHVDGSYLGVYLAFSYDYGRAWHMGGKLLLPPELAKDMKKPYKAAFVPDSTDIMISIEDTLGRWHIYRVPFHFSEMEDT